MLKHENKVSRLSESEKIELLTNIVGMSETELLSFGLPALKVGRLSEMTKNIYPAPQMLACSWNDELIYKVGRSSAELSAARGINFLLTPGAKIKLDPYSDALTEDVCLGSSVASAYAEGAASVGGGVCVADMGIERDELKWLGDPPDRRVLYEYIVRPYQLARKSADIAVGVQRDLRRDGFDGVGAELCGAVRDFDGGTRLVCESVGASDTVRMINRQIVCLQGAGYAISAALRKYDIIKKAVDRGELEENELMSAIESGDAISSEMLDAAVDRLIDLVESCTPASTNAESVLNAVNGIAYDAAAESAVLLKNFDHALPISKKKKVAIIGDIALADREFTDALASRLQENGAVVAGLARGYDLGEDASSSELESEALEIAKCADTVLFFVGTSEQREKYITSTKNLSLPANQDMLARELKKSAKATVALLDSRYSVDIAAVEQLSALMTVSCTSQASAKILADILMGVISPSGKLASTFYRNTDKSFTSRERQLGCEVSVGRFIGYRYYDSADYDVGFPFGHGLSYTSFDYSDMTLESGGKVSLTVKNTGRMRGAETVQIYAGLEDRNALCPKKELIAYKKIFLEAGESVKLSFELKLPRAFDVESGELAVRKGRYTVYAGSSLTDIRRSVKINSDGAELQSPNEPLSRYLLCESNIITDNYTLEAKYPIMKRAIKNIISGVAMLLIAILLQVYCVSTNTASAFLNILTVIILGIAVVFFVLDAFDRKRMADNERILAQKENEKWFEDATHLETFDTDKMFEEEFSAEQTELEEEEEEETPVAAVSDEYLAYIDKDLTLVNIANELSAFALERGCKLEKRTVYTLLGALSSSRFIILNGLPKEEFSSLASVLCEYMECNFHMDVADSSYTSGEAIFMRVDENGNKIKSGALRTVEEAGASQSELHVAPIANVSVEMLENCFEDIVKYAKNPALPSLLSAVDGKYRFSRNILFLVGLDSQRTLSEIPASVAEVATVCDVKLTLTDRAANLSCAHKLKLYQLEYMADGVAASGVIDEDDWKKLDAFEGYVKERTGYAIGNKRWISIEKYASVYTSAGGDSAEALDEAIASRLLPSVIGACRSAQNAVEISLGDAIESIFGENEMDSSRRAVRNARLYAKDQGETNV